MLLLKWFVLHFLVTCDHFLLPFLSWMWPDVILNCVYFSFSWLVSLFRSLKQQVRLLRLCSNRKKRILAKRERGAQIRTTQRQSSYYTKQVDGGRSHLPTFAHYLPVFYDSMDDKDSSTHTQSMDKYEKWFNFSPVFHISTIFLTFNGSIWPQNDLKMTSTSV